MNRADHKLEGEHLDLLDKLAAAKRSGDRKRLAAAKAELQAFRVKWRGIRDAFAATAAGTAAPKTVKATTRKAGN